MTWTTPATPVAGTAITVSFYGTNIRDNLSHLRGMLPDAGAANQLLNSSGTTSAAWTPSPTISGNFTQSGGAVTHTLQRSSGDANQVAFVLARQAGGLWQWRLPSSSNDSEIEQVGLGTFIKFVLNGGVSVERDANFTGALTKSGTAVSLDGHSHGSFVSLSGDSTISGNLTVNRLRVMNNANATDTALQVGQANTGLFNSSGAPTEIHFSGGGTDRGRVDSAGVLFWEGNISGADIIDRSDQRIKRDIERITPDVSGLRSLPVSRFTYIGDERNRELVGFVAQDVRTRIPWAVMENNDELGISLPSMCAALVLYCQAHDARLEALEARLGAP